MATTPRDGDREASQSPRRPPRQRARLVSPARPPRARRRSGTPTARRGGRRAGGGRGGRSGLWGEGEMSERANIARISAKSGRRAVAEAARS